MDEPTLVSRVSFPSLRERPNLGALCAQVMAAFGRASPMAYCGPDVVAARLDTLRGPLRAHFEEFERSGLLERVEEESPERAALCARLRGEYVSLLRQLDRLRTASAIERRGGWWTNEVRALIDDLTGLAAREDALLQTPAGSET